MYTSFIYPVICSQKKRTPPGGATTRSKDMQPFNLHLWRASILGPGGRPKEYPHLTFYGITSIHWKILCPSRNILVFLFFGFSPDFSMGFFPRDFLPWIELPKKPQTNPFFPGPSRCWPWGFRFATLAGLVFSTWLVRSLMLHEQSRNKKQIAYMGCFRN